MFRSQMEMLLKVMIFPFSSIECYNHDYIADLANSKNYSEYRNIYKKEFKNILFESLKNKYSIHNLDYIDMIIEKYYSHSFIRGKSSNNIANEVLSLLAKSFICHRNGRLALKYWESENDDQFIGPYKGINKIALWNTLNRMMCTNLIALTYLLDNGMKEERFLSGYYSSIMLEDVQLEKILSKGEAETHIHKNAGINFTVSWTHLMNLGTVENDDYKEEYLVNLGSKEKNINLLVAATAILRLMLVRFLQSQEESFNLYISEFKESHHKNDNKIIKIIKKIYNGEDFKSEEWELYDFKEIWEKLQFKFDIKLYEDDEDYIGQFLSSPRKLKTTGENLFLFKALKHIKEINPQDETFAKLFFQYVKIKNAVFQAKVQEDSIKGLKNFQPIYGRSSKLFGYDSQYHWLTLMHCQFQNRHLRKLEFRFAFNNYDVKNKRYVDSFFYINLKNSVRSFLKAYYKYLEEWKDMRDNYLSYENPPQIGLVFHMIKELDNQWYEKCWQNTYFLEDDRDIDKELFYTANQKYYLKQIEAFNKLRREIPYLDKFLIGIDAASIEDNTEPWVFAPVYQRARNSQDSCLIYNNGVPMQTLGFTFHVGEDFRHILTGLRHVDEVIEHFSYHAGDRIGHGIALGVDTEYWCRNNEIVMLPRGEYLDDLLWVWGLSKNRKGLEYVDISYLEEQIMSLAEEIFQCIDGITVYMLWKAYKAKFNEFQIDEKFKWDFCTTKDNKMLCKYLPENLESLGQHWSYEALIYVQHCRCYAEKLLEPIQVEIDKSNINLYSYLQELLLDKINNRGIIIETNPTSNLSIGEMKDLFNHYIFNLNDLDINNKHSRAMITINSDDPSVFNTNVSNEMSYIFYALQKKGFSREESLQWIDKVRNYGMQSSFLQNDDITYEGLLEQIKSILKELEL